MVILTTLCPQGLDSSSEYIKSTPLGIASLARQPPEMGVVSFLAYIVDRSKKENPL